MKSVFAPLAALAALATGALAQTFTINTPSNVVVCLPILLQWSGGVAPYELFIQPGNQPGAAALEDLGAQTGTSFTWIANQPVGTSVGLALRDSTGQTALSAAFDILPGSNTSCVGVAQASSSDSSAASSTGSVSSAGSASSVATTSGGATSSIAATTTASSASISSHSTASGASTTAPGSTTSRASTTASSGAAAATTSTTNSAVTNSMYGAAGIIGAAIMVLLA